MRGQDVIKGTKHVEHMIEKMLKGALLKFAKKIGLKKLAKKLFKIVNDPFREIMKALHLKIKLKIPGMNKIKGVEKKLKPLLNNLENKLKSLNLKLDIPTISPCNQLSKSCK